MWNLFTVRITAYFALGRVIIGLSIVSRTKNYLC